MAQMINKLRRHGRGRILFFLRAMTNAQRQPCRTGKLLANTIPVLYHTFTLIV